MLYYWLFRIKSYGKLLIFSTQRLPHAPRQHRKTDADVLGWTFHLLLSRTMGSTWSAARGRWRHGTPEVTHGRGEASPATGKMTSGATILSFLDDSFGWDKEGDEAVSSEWLSMTEEVSRTIECSTTRMVTSRQMTRNRQRMTAMGSKPTMRGGRMTMPTSCFTARGWLEPSPLETLRSWTQQRTHRCGRPVWYNS
jgi:hypothetical protein